MTRWEALDAAAERRWNRRYARRGKLIESMNASNARAQAASRRRRVQLTRLQTKLASRSA